MSFITPAYSQVKNHNLDRLKCEKLARKAEEKYQLPKNILLSIARVESGYGKVEGITRSWPWTLNAGGNSAYFETKTDAIKDLKGNIISRIAYRRSNGGGMHADWAILKLDKEVKRSEVKPIEYLIPDISVGDSISIAGYAKDKNSAGNRFDLNYGECKVTEIATDIRLSDCTAVKGNSGGAVMRKIDQYNFGLAGIISEGNERNISSFVPIKIFYPELQKYMSKRINLSEKYEAQLPNSGPN